MTGEMKQKALEQTLKQELMNGKYLKGFIIGSMLQKKSGRG